MNIISVIGNRPQFIKTVLVSKEIRKTDTEIIVHTGQHYDENLSDVFFKELNIPNPDINLGIAETDQGKQTGLMIMGIEEILIQEAPDCIVVYGDTNSTLAGAIAASKLHIPIMHIEAGLRSYNKKMPEEINRILTDHVSTLLFCPNNSAIQNLHNEGISVGVFNCGDVMEEIFFTILKEIDSKKGDPYGYMTLHRAENTDEKSILNQRIMQVSELNINVKWPIHPRTKKKINNFKIEIPSNIEIIEPQGYYDNINHIKNAKFIITDSGGLQKESYWAGVPCYTLRNETEWGYTVESGWNSLVPAEGDLKQIMQGRTIPSIKYLREQTLSESRLIVETIKNNISSS